MLDIIVPHYDEPWETGRKFFDMLGCQRGIDFNDIRVILVHDGTEPFSAWTFSRYPYRVDQYRIPHGGVSAARNYGLDKATAEWVEFCDFDDMYSHVYALMSILPMMARDVDYMWTPFFCEQAMDGKLIVGSKTDENAVWVHGKYFRRTWLIENNIRFPEGIFYSEDSVFCTLVTKMVKLGRHGQIKTGFPVYTWVNRPDSVSADPLNADRNMSGFIDRNFRMVEECIRHGIPHTLTVGRMFADAYCVFHLPGKAYPEDEKRFRKDARQYAGDIQKLTLEDIQGLLLAAARNIRGAQICDPETFMAWVAEITKE